MIDDLSTFGDIIYDAIGVPLFMGDESKFH